MRNYNLKEDKNRFFFPEDYERVYDMMRGKIKHGIHCLLNTGARINEMRHVKVEDVNLENKWLILKVTKTKAKKGEKKGTPRMIPISSKFCNYLRKYINDNKLHDEDTFGIVSNVAINNGLKRNAGKCGLKNPRDFSAHSLRKTLECWLMALNVGDMKVVRHIGHDIRTAISHYVSPDIFSYEQKQRMRKIIGDLYEERR